MLRVAQEVEPRSNFPRHFAAETVFLQCSPPTPPAPGRGPVASLPRRDFASALSLASGLVGRGVLAAPSVWPHLASPLSYHKKITFFGRK